MPLNFYLKKNGYVTGPLAKNTSASSLQVIKNDMLGKPRFKGDEIFLAFGNSLHQRFLVNKNNYKVTIEDCAKIDKMLTKLNAHPVVKSLMQKAICENKLYSELNNVKIAYILDILQQHKSVGADLKTTTCNSLAQCVEKSLEFGYFNQGLVYKKCARLKHFYFVFIQKNEPHNIFILDVSKYPEHESYAERELEFLLYFYRNYGNIIPTTTTINGNVTSPKDVAINNNLKTMAKRTGREHLQMMKETVKELKAHDKAYKKSLDFVAKYKGRLHSLYVSFPAKEKELYQEKIDDLVKGLIDLN
jgi:hypothetical protein